MNGRNHMAAGGAVSALLAATAVLSGTERAPEALAAAGRPLLAAHAWAIYGAGMPGAKGIALTACCGAFLALGLVLPDIDLANSTASKLAHFSLPLRHRGFTHTVWAILLFLAAGAFLWRPLAAIGAGMLVHDLLDWPSQAGWSPFYPLGKHRIFHDTVMARNHRFVLYSSASPGSEAVASGLVIMICVLAIAFEAYLALWPA